MKRLLLLVLASLGALAGCATSQPDAALRGTQQRVALATNTADTVNDVQDARSRKEIVITPVFSSGSAQLDASATDTLERVAQYLKANPGRKAVIQRVPNSARVSVLISDADGTFPSGASGIPLAPSTLAR